MAWGIFIAVWVAIGCGLHWLNSDMPDGVWVLAYWLPLALIAICVSMARENASPWRCARCGQLRAVKCEYAHGGANCPTWTE